MALLTVSQVKYMLHGIHGILNHSVCQVHGCIVIIKLWVSIVRMRKDNFQHMTGYY